MSYLLLLPPSSTPLLLVVLIAFATSPFTAACSEPNLLVDGICLPPCYDACFETYITCEASIEDWIERENIPCWAPEIDQETGDDYIRTSCRCPRRDFSTLEDPGLKLNECISAGITSRDVVNLPDLATAHIRSITATDINFLKDARSRTRICSMSARTISFLGDPGDIYAVVRGSFFGNIVAKKLSFHLYNLNVIDNNFGQVDVGTLEVINDDEYDSSSIQEISRNYWNSIKVNQCVVDVVFLPTIYDNVCTTTADGLLDGCDEFPFDDGFTCFG